VRRRILQSTLLVVTITALVLGLPLAITTWRLMEDFTRAEILREVWNDPDLKTSKTLDMHMSWLRRKIGGERRIATVRGVGFRFNHD
jgi:DNA-binding response OmpR family regulator